MDNKLKIKFPSHSLIIGKTETGKSYFIKSILRKSIDYFDIVIIYCSTNDVSGDYDEFAGYTDKVAIYSDHEEFLEVISDEKFREDIILDKNTKKLIIVDDFIGNIELHAYKNLFNPFASMGRHVNLSVIISSQHVNECTPCQRMNSKYVFVTKASDNNIKALYELSSGFEKKNDLKKFIESHDLVEITTKFNYNR